MALNIKDPETERLAAEADPTEKCLMHLPHRAGS
jgi:hypothetical protein